MEIKSPGLRYWLWKRDIHRLAWIPTLAEWARCSEDRAGSILEGGFLKPEEQTRIAQVLNIEEALVQYPFSDADLNILAENLEYLLADLKSKEVAEAIDVDANTLSRWKNGKQPPRPEHLARLRDYLGLPPDINLCEDMLFLSLEPISDLQRRAWLTSRINAMAVAEVRSLYPALRKLLQEE